MRRAVSILKGLWNLWKAFAHILGVVNTFVLLSLTYILLFGPAALVLRFSGRDMLRKKWYRQGARWIAKPNEPETIETYTHPF